MKLESNKTHSDKRSLEAQLRGAEDLNRRLLACNPDAVMVVNGGGAVLMHNPKARALAPSARELAGRIWFEWVGERERGKAAGAFHSATRGHTENFQTFSRREGQLCWWSVTVAPLRQTSGVADLLWVAFRDITPFKKFEHAWRETEERFRRVFENGPLGMVLIDLESRVTKINNAFGRMLGYAPADVMLRPLAEIAYPGDVLMLVKQLKRMFAQEISDFQLEMRCQAKNRDLVWVCQTAALIQSAEGSPGYGVVMFEEIQERKQAEAQVSAYQQQLQSLASELSLSEERERRRLATHLHDQIGQTLAFAKLKIGAILQPLHRSPLWEPLSEVRRLIEQCIDASRSLTFELSPPVLYELGLAPALEWLAQVMSQKHGIRCDFQDDNLPKPLDDEFKAALFQAARELLANVVKHAHATQVLVCVRKEGDALRIVIEDDGVGFDADRLQADVAGMKGFGLFNIRERLDYLGGKMNIRSAPGRGARITLLAPLRVSPLKEGHEDSSAAGR